MGLKIPHFYHYRHSNCIEYSEHETEAHVAMKDCFQNTLKIHEDFVEYGKIDGVRPDLLWNNKYALEVQHSPINPINMDKRNVIYRKNKIIPVWIFHQQLEEKDAFFTEDIGVFGKLIRIIASSLDISEPFYFDNSWDHEIYRPEWGKYSEKSEEILRKPHYKPYNILKLSPSERCLFEVQGGLFYIQFPKKFMKTGLNSKGKFETPDKFDK